jgi:hypothetical protein
MMLSETAPSVNVFFKSYRIEFDRLVAPTIVGHFAYSGHIVGNTDAATLS